MPDDRAERGEVVFYRKNVAARESVVRIVTGLLIIGCSLSQLGATPLGLVLAGSGAVSILTGLFGYCPACALFGRRPLDGPR
jgi:hypothetical protein